MSVFEYRYGRVKKVTSAMLLKGVDLQWIKDALLFLDKEVWTEDEFIDQANAQLQWVTMPVGQNGVDKDHVSDDIIELVRTASNKQ